MKSKDSEKKNKMGIHRCVQKNSDLDRQRQQPMGNIEGTYLNELFNLE